MSAHQLTLTDDERKYLVELLERTLKDKRVEEHRTRTPSFREHLLVEETLIEGMLGRLREPAPSAV